MQDGSPFGIGALWENWRDPTTRPKAAVSNEVSKALALDTLERDRCKFL